MELFGDPRPYVGIDGTVSRQWERDILGMAQFPAPLPLAWDRSIFVSHFRCHRRLVRIFEQVLGAIWNVPEAWATVNDFGGCYEFRKVRGSKSLSRHSWGIAIDLDVCDNPFGSKPRVDARVREVFAAHGFAWGGDFTPKRRDGQHMEFADAGRLT